MLQFHLVVLLSCPSVAFLELLRENDMLFFAAVRLLESPSLLELSLTSLSMNLRTREKRHRQIKRYGFIFSSIDMFY